MSKLIVVPASEVGDRPRWWCASRSVVAQDGMVDLDGEVVTAGELHLDPPEYGEQFAIVEADDPPRPPREEEVWTALLVASVGSLTHASGIGEAVAIADAAVEAWRARWAK